MEAALPLLFVLQPSQLLPVHTPTTPFSAQPPAHSPALGPAPPCDDNHVPRHGCCATDASSPPSCPVRAAGLAFRCIRAASLGDCTTTLSFSRLSICMLGLQDGT